jgi:hypothetical protein
MVEFFTKGGSQNMRYAKGAVSSEEDRTRYEDLYREAWEAQCKRDAEIDPRVNLKSTRKEDGRVSRWHKRV